MSAERDPGRASPAAGVTRHGTPGRAGPARSAGGGAHDGRAGRSRLARRRARWRSRGLTRGWRGLRELWARAHCAVVVRGRIAGAGTDRGADPAAGSGQPERASPARTQRIRPRPREPRPESRFRGLQRYVSPRWT